MDKNLLQACLEEISFLVLDSEKKVNVKLISNNYNVDLKEASEILDKWLKNRKGNQEISKEYLVKGTVKDNGKAVITIVSEKKLSKIKDNMKTFVSSLYSIETPSNCNRINLPDRLECQVISLLLNDGERKVVVAATPVENKSSISEPKQTPKVDVKPSTSKNVATMFSNHIKKEDDVKKSPKKSPVKVQETPKKNNDTKPQKKIQPKGSIATFFTSNNTKQTSSSNTKPKEAKLDSPKNNNNNIVKEEQKSISKTTPKNNNNNIGKEEPKKVTKTTPKSNNNIKEEQKSVTNKTPTNNNTNIIKERKSSKKNSLQESINRIIKETMKDSDSDIEFIPPTPEQKKIYTETIKDSEDSEIEVIPPTPKQTQTKKNTKSLNLFVSELNGDNTDDSDTEIKVNKTKEDMVVKTKKRQKKHTPENGNSKKKSKKMLFDSSSDEDVGEIKLIVTEDNSPIKLNKEQLKSPKKYKAKRFVNKTYEDKDGYIRTVKEIEEYSCSEEEENDVTAKNIKPNSIEKSSKVENKKPAKKISPPVKNKTKQGSIMNFFSKK